MTIYLSKFRIWMGLYTAALTMINNFTSKTLITYVNMKDLLKRYNTEYTAGAKHAKRPLSHVSRLFTKKWLIRNF